eukprot:359159-Chlamydomonas_euryale.AAC.30
MQTQYLCGIAFVPPSRDDLKQPYCMLLALTFAGQAVVAAAGMASPLVKSFGDRLCIDGSVANLKDVDTAYWAYWLAETGYDNVMGEPLAGAPAHANGSICTPTPAWTCMSRFMQASIRPAHAPRTDMVCSLVGWEMYHSSESTAQHP